MSPNLVSIEDVRLLSATEITKLTNPQLKTALATIVASYNSNENTSGPTNADILKELHDIKKDLKELNSLKEEVTDLRNEIKDLQTENKELKRENSDVFSILHNQQIFIESVEQEKRQCNLIINGVPEAADNIGRDDYEKIKSILRAAGCTVDVSDVPAQRLGVQDQRGKRPLKLTLKTKKDRDIIVGCGKNLKQGANSGSAFSAIYLRKDVHPIIRKEHFRLRNRENEEKTNNPQARVEYDHVRRVLLRDGLVIDRFSPKYF